MAKPRKKYNQARSRAHLKELQAQNKERRLRAALVGASLSYNSEWPTTEYHPTGFEKAMEITGNNVDFVCAMAVSWPFNWEILLTVYCTDDYGKFYDQPVLIEAEHKPMSRLEDYIEFVVLPEAKSRCNQRHIKSWGYLATIQQTTLPQ